MQKPGLRKLRRPKGFGAKSIGQWAKRAVQQAVNRTALGCANSTAGVLKSQQCKFFYRDGDQLTKRYVSHREDYR